MASINDDWLTDFGAAPKTDAELETWLARCTSEENADLRQLILEAQIMRWSARILLEQLRELGASNGEITLAAHFIEARKP